MKTYIYICSSGHSGSTLLDMLLGSNSRIESLGEITQLPKNVALNTLCTCGKPVRRCPLWQNVLRVMGNAMGADLISSPYKLNLGFFLANAIVDKSHQTLGYHLKRKIIKGIAYADLAYGRAWLPQVKNPIDEGIYNNFRLYDTVMKIQSVDCIVDSSKDYLKGVKLYCAEPRRVKLILLTRNGKGVFFSNIKREYPKKRSLVKWRNYYKRTLKLVKKYVPESNILFLKYEDLVNQPQLVLEKICKYVGIEYESAMLDFANHQHHIANGNNMRFQNSSKIRSDEMWKSGLTKADHQLFSEICGSINLQLGYV